MSQTWQRRAALGLALAAFAISTAALVVAIVRRGPAPGKEAELAEPVGSNAPAGNPLEARDAVRRLDATHYEVSRKVVAWLRRDPQRLATTARIAPAQDGFRLLAIRPGSLIERLGFQNGDTIRAIDGMNVSNPASALETYEKLAGSEVTIDFERDGSPLQISVEIR